MIKIVELYVLIVTLGAAAMITSAHADMQQCAGIKNDRERLACFDKAAAPPAAQPSPAATKTVEMRAAYTLWLRHALLERGLDIKVFDEERADRKYSDTFPVYPRLTIFGPVNAPLAYRLIVAADLLNKAKSYGYAGVRFFADDGYFDFDISKDRLPNCDETNRVCLH